MRCQDFDALLLAVAGRSALLDRAGGRLNLGELLLGVDDTTVVGRRVQWPDEAAQVPVRRPRPAGEPLVGQLVTGLRADQVVRERLDDPLAHVERHAAAVWGVVDSVGASSPNERMAAPSSVNEPGRGVWFVS